MPQLHAIIHGRVQGVSFRYATQMKAKELNLGGWVRNLPDGTVEALAVGPKETLEDFLKWLHHGPSGAKVTKVDHDWLDTPQADYPSFEIKYGADR